MSTQFGFNYDGNHFKAELDSVTKEQWLVLTGYCSFVKSPDKHYIAPGNDCHGRDVASHFMNILTLIDDRVRREFIDFYYEVENKEFKACLEKRYAK